MYPIVGSFLEFIKIANDKKGNEEDPMFPSAKMLLKYFTPRPPHVTAVMHMFKPAIIINTPEPLEEIYIT